MAARHNKTSVGTSATVIEGTQYPGYILRNPSAVTVFIGDSGVTAAAGFPIFAGEDLVPIEMSHKQLRGLAGDRLYGIVSTTTNDVFVLIPGKVAV